MCRKYLVHGLMLAAFGIGMLLGCLLGNWIALLVGLAAIVGGVLLIRKT